MPIRHYPIRLLAVLCLCAASATFGKEPPKAQEILPASLAGWTCAARTPLDTAHPFGPVAGDPVALVAEYGFVSGEQCKYTRGPNGQDAVYAQLYIMKD